MPSKAKKKQELVSKKNLQKKKERNLDDQTFGLKNKNKSSKVQAHVKSVTTSIMNSNADPRQKKIDEQKKQEKASRKVAKKAEEAEQAALFGAALLAVSKKGPKFGGKDGKVESKGRDHGDDDKGKSSSRAMKLMYQMDAQEMEDKLKEDPNYVPTLEDEVEAQRQKKIKELKASGKSGTPVTEASFKLWQERKRKRKEVEAKKMVEVEMKKKKGGKGLSVLSGKELYAYKKDLFKDQDDDGAAASAAIENGDADKTKAAVDGTAGVGNVAEMGVAAVAEKVEKNLFLEGSDDDDLDDIDDD